MKTISIIFLSILGCVSSKNKQNVFMQSPLTCEIAINTQNWIKGNIVKINYVLKNISTSKIKIAKSIAGNDAIWFRIKITDAYNNTIISGLENQFISTRSLPQLIICDLQPNEKVEVPDSLVLDKSTGFINYDLKPGKYIISTLYRFEPYKEPDAAGLCISDAEKKKIWTGVIESAPVKIRINNN